MHKHLTLLALSATSLAVAGLLISRLPQVLPIGGSPGSLMIEAHEDLAFLREKEEILQSHFASLRAEESKNKRERAAIERALAKVSMKSQDAIGRRVAAFESYRQALTQRLNHLSAVNRDLREARAVLSAISGDRERLEAMIRQEYNELAHNPHPTIKEKYVRIQPGEFALLWPVYPSKGISAGFMEKSYKKRFGFDHFAVDIPQEQGTLIHATANGIVSRVSDMGYGYSTLKIAHDYGLETVYGHVSEFLVREGEAVTKGQAIAKVGGRPGTKGAGFYTTGSHLHFETRIDGEAMDPTEFLAPIEVVMGE
ncbi:MAG TPA: M23 family metallopeptidase [Candidatus Peribacterales bacterium]|nr:M23 family metallopeptidase [Candidatus Peribacterales bacterium]